MAMLPRSQERTLVRQALQGDGRAVEALIQAHQEALYAFMLRMCGRPDVAEDIVQEAFVRVLKNLERFDDRFRFSTWLFTIAKRLYMNAVQKQKPLYDSEAINLQTGTLGGASGDSSRTEMLGNVRGLLDDALASLTEQQREIVLLFHQQSWAITDIAIYLKMPEGTVKSHLHRARKRMKRFIESDRKLIDQVNEVWS